MGRRILNRKGMRADYDAAERRKEEEEEKDEDEEEKDEDEDEEGEDEDGEDEGDGDLDAESEGEGGDEDEDEEAPKKKKKKVVAKPKAKPKPRSRAAKITRLRVVWGVFSNSNQCLATYEYPKKQEALDHASRLTTDKRSTHFVQPVKEPMEEKKEKEK